MSRRFGVFLLALALALVFVPSVWGAEVGNLYQSDDKRLKLELKCDHQTREVELDDKFDFLEAIEVSEPYLWRDFMMVKDFDGEEVSDRYYLKGSYAVTPKVEVYAKVGMGRLKSKFFDPLMIYGYDEYEGGELVYTDYDGELMSQVSGKGDHGFLGGLGVKTIFYQKDTFQVGLDVQYLYQESDDVLLLHQEFYGWSEPGYGRYYDGDRLEFDESKTQEAHLALIASKKMGNFTPYGGIKVSWYETEYDGKFSYLEKYEDFENPEYSYSNSEKYDFDFETKQQDYIGIFVGADYDFTENFGVNAEVRLGDEEGFSTGLCWKF